MRISEFGPVKFAPHCTGQGLRNVKLIAGARKAYSVKLKAQSKISHWVIESLVGY